MYIFCVYTILNIFVNNVYAVDRKILIMCIASYEMIKAMIKNIVIEKYQRILLRFFGILNEIWKYQFDTVKNNIFSYIIGDLFDHYVDRVIIETFAVACGGTLSKLGTVS